MSIEIHVLFHGKLPSKAALTRCFKELGFPLRFAPGSGSLEQHKGYLPMRLRGEESGVEFDTYDGREAGRGDRRQGDRPALHAQRQFPFGR